MIKKFFVNLGLFLGILHKIKSDLLCVEYGCITRKSINCPEGMCTKHHIMWHRTLEWFEGIVQPFWIYHCQNKLGPDKAEKSNKFKPNLKLEINNG